MTSESPKWKFGIFRTILEDLSSGLPREEAAKRIDGALGNKGCRKTERRYNCLECLDQGRVEIWHPACIRDFAQDQVHPDDARHRISVVACYCDRGKAHASRLPRFDRLVHCKVVPLAGATGQKCSAKAVENLLIWLEDQKTIRKDAVEDPLFHQEGT